MGALLSCTAYKLFYRVDIVPVAMRDADFWRMGDNVRRRGSM